MTATIFALASAPGRGGVSVYRLSGPLARQAVETLAGFLPPPRMAKRARLVHRDETIDDGLVLWFPGPASFTGEDVAELHLHGGRAVTQALSAVLVELGLRPAEAGEFSRRAFQNGKLDLTRAEAIADLVDAETAAQRRQALLQLDGGLDRLAEDWRQDLLRALALLEACIDFSDEDLPDGVIEQAMEQVRSLAAELDSHLAEGVRHERLRDGIHVAILGAPNAGKSSLLNRIAGREAAIVSATAGTTRDVIEIHLDLGGWPVVLADTAGLREAGEEIEAEGIRRALAKAEAADLKMLVFDAGLDPDPATSSLVGPDSLVVVNKTDQGRPPNLVDLPQAIMVSARTGDGIALLLETLRQQVADRFQITQAPALTRSRHRAAAQEARQALERFDPALGLELAAEELRRAAQSIGRIAGRVDVEDILDIVFRDFCIGK
jgi:tRNA modification GTPase